MPKQTAKGHIAPDAQEFVLLVVMFVRRSRQRTDYGHDSSSGIPASMHLWFDSAPTLEVCHGIPLWQIFICHDSENPNNGCICLCGSDGLQFTKSTSRVKGFLDDFNGHFHF
jgi:hypothetical protein